MYINLVIRRECQSSQLMDGIYSYFQSLTDDYTPKIEIRLGTGPVDSAMNVLLEYMPKEVDPNIDSYHLVLFCNGGEPLMVCTPTIKSLLSRNHVYLIANSRIPTTHELYDKILWYPHNLFKHRDFWLRFFYPQFFENFRNRRLSKLGTMIGINGSGRVWRQWAFDCIAEQIPGFVVKGGFGNTLKKVDHAHWESDADRIFREWVNLRYQNDLISGRDSYYTSKVGLGFDGKFGYQQPGTFVIPEYFQYNCIVYPETNWQNDELCVTEKALKCFYAGSLPWPMSGRNVNAYYNEIGFFTAWNLLPESFKEFDAVEDHVERHRESAKALRWLHEHPQVFESELFESMTDQNWKNFIRCEPEYQALCRIGDVMQERYQDVCGH